MTCQSSLEMSPSLTRCGSTFLVHIGNCLLFVERSMRVARNTCDPRSSGFFQLGQPYRYGRSADALVCPWAAYTGCILTCARP